MDNKEYRERKIEKMTRDALRRINKIPSFGYGDTVDVIAKNIITNNIISLIRLYDLQDDHIIDMEILSSSLLDEVTDQTLKLLQSFGEIEVIDNE